MLFVANARAFLLAFFLGLFSISVSGQSTLTYAFATFHAGSNAGVVSDAGDVNGDGFADVIVGAPNDDLVVVGTPAAARGIARVYSGKDGSQLFAFVGVAAGDLFGGAVAGAGDVNGDGFDDLIVGASNADGPLVDVGTASVFSGIDGSIIHTFQGSNSFELFGYEVDGIGDVNSDGFDDLAVAIPGNDVNGNDAGAVQVFSGLNGSLIVSLYGDSSGDLFGASLSAAGDVNADGVPDLIVGVPFDDNTFVNSGSARVFSGSNWNILFTFDGDLASSALGFSVSGAGDVNSDGYADLIVGAPEMNGALSATGRVKIYSGLNGGQLYVFDGTSTSEELGYSVSDAGDVNADGFDDVIIGQSADFVVGANRAYIRSGADGSIMEILSGNASNNQFGRHVSGAGDTNGDGFPDLIVGDPSAMTGPGMGGAAYVVAAPVVIADDLELLKIVTPLNDSINCLPRLATEVIKVDIRSNGFNQIPAGSLLVMSFQIDGGIIVNEVLFLNSPMNEGDILRYNFNSTADLSAIGDHVLAVSVTFGPDSVPFNDSMTTTIGSGGQLRVTSYPWVEDFPHSGAFASTELPFGFINEIADSTGIFSDWMTRNNDTPTASTGPSADHTGGVAGLGGYAYIDDSSNHAAISVRSPCFDLFGLAVPRLQFFLHSWNATFASGSNALAIDVMDYSAASFVLDVFQFQLSTGDNWTRQVVDLSPFSGHVIQLLIRGETSTNTLGQNDIAIDDLSVYDSIGVMGQPPVPGMAVLDINEPQNLNGDPLFFAADGPYFTSVATGGVLTFKMSGQPFMPITLFSGPLNPIVASYPGIGSVDLGGPVNPSTGIPSLLTILADGNLSGGLNPFFVTSSSGTTTVGFTVPNLPSGILGSFQCVFATLGGVGFRLSNAVQVSIQ